MSIFPKIRIQKLGQFEEPVEKPKIFCTTCHIRLNNKMFGNKGVEFSEGWFCENCTYLRNKQLRGEQKYEPKEHP